MLGRLTARLTFPGETVSDTIAAILEHDPDWTRLPGATPVSVHRLIERCLEKDLKHRAARVPVATGEDATTCRQSRAVASPWLPLCVTNTVRCCRLNLQQLFGAQCSRYGRVCCPLCRPRRNESCDHGNQHSCHRQQ
jgi:hypothetical protein